MSGDRGDDGGDHVGGRDEDKPAPSGPLSFDGESAADREARAEEERLRWAHRRDPDLPEVLAGETKRGPVTGRYTWFVGVAFLVVIGVVLLNSLRSEGVGSTGIEPGKRMPVFAAPLVLSQLEGDVNVATKANQKDAGRRPACEVRGPAILNACELWAKPVVLAFYADRSQRCVRELDRMERLRVKYPDVNFAAVSIRGSRNDQRKLVRAHGWQFPVAYDRDGVLANLYGAAVCPHITFARAGGTVVETTLGEADLDELEAQVRRLR